MVEVQPKKDRRLAKRKKINLEKINNKWVNGFIVVGRQGQDVSEQDSQVCKVARCEGSMEVKAKKKGQEK